MTRVHPTSGTRLPRLSPLRAADLSGLPPQWWSSRSTTHSAARARRTPSGWPRRVRTEVGRFDGLIHGFFTLGPVSEAAQTAIDESLELFAKLLAGG